ncbi:MAG TPA: hypothetical protein VMR37_07745 [Rhabdochlamydiaceae bacterium]|nr:hypothetical protein [Rhabdochlamydiaceae bacterium]
MALATLALITANPHAAVFRSQRADQTLSQKTAKVAQGNQPPSVTASLSLKEVVVQTQQDQTPAVAKKILTREEELEKTVLSTKDSKFRNATLGIAGLALFFGALGFINPVFFAVAVILLIGAVCCGAESVMAKKDVQLAAAELKVIEKNKQLKILSDIEQVLTGDILDEGSFTPQELIPFTGRTVDGTLNAFSSFNRGFVYPYTLSQVERKEGKSYTDALFEHFSTQAVGVPQPEFFKKCLEGEHGEFLQKRAIQMGAFLKLLGDKNNPTYPNMGMNISEITLEMGIDPQPTKPGSLSTDCTLQHIGNSIVCYTVDGEEVGLFARGDIGQPDANPQALFRASRSIWVSVPDESGNVQYSIVHQFRRIH